MKNENDRRSTQTLQFGHVFYTCEFFRAISANVRPNYGRHNDIRFALSWYPSTIQPNSSKIKISRCSFRSLSLVQNTGLLFITTAWQWWADCLTTVLLEWLRPRRTSIKRKRAKWGHKYCDICPHPPTENVTSIIPPYITIKRLAHWIILQGMRSTLVTICKYDVSKVGLNGNKDYSSDSRIKSQALCDKALSFIPCRNFRFRYPPFSA